MPISSLPKPLRVRLIDFLRRKLGYQFPPLGSAIHRSVFAILPQRIDVSLFPGIFAELDMNDATQRGTYWQGERFEHPTPAILHRWMENRDAIFFDIGSNYGWFSFFLATRNPALPIHAFEPNPRTYALLESIVERNRLKNIHTWNCGLGDQSGSARLNLGVEDSGHSTFGAHPDLHHQTDAEIPIETFDDWRKKAAIPLPTEPQWVAKIDVEGFELRVIRGMHEALAARAFRGLAVEVLPSTLAFCGTSEQELLQLIASYGYIERDTSPFGRVTANRFFEPKTLD
jgi:FkbM family methyltransferase